MTGVMDSIPEMTLTNCRLIEGLAAVALGILQIARKEEWSVVSAYCERHPGLADLLKDADHIRQELRRQEKADA